MTTERYKQIRFSFQRKVVVDFQGDTITSDAGLLLVREFDKRWKLTENVIGCVQDCRDSRYVTHPIGTLLRQRIYQIGAGYEAAHDADQLRSDPTFKVINY